MVDRRYEVSNRMSLQHLKFIGSIPEKDTESDKFFNTCTVYNPQGKISDLLKPHRTDECRCR